MKKEIDVLFFERPLVDLKRYALKIAKELKLISRELSIATISLEVPEEKQRKDINYCFYRKEIKDIDRFLTEHKVKVIVFTNPRIPDMEMILHAHHLKIKTVMIQEGVIFEGANINDVSTSNILSAIKYIPKTISYFGILNRMCRYEHKSYFSLLKELVTKKKNITSIVAHFFSPYLIGDYVFTMGEFWAEYYLNTMLYSPNRIRVIGDHDLDGLAANNGCESAICYIATVLVEDGTRTKTEFDTFTKALAETLDKNTKLYIKLHPRSDKHLYDCLSEHNVEFISEGPLPSTTIYIGHRSTLLARALYESDNLIIWRFSNEQADFFEQFASFICESKNDLMNALSVLDINKYSNDKKKLMEKIFWPNPHGAINTAATMIYDYLINDTIRSHNSENTEELF